MNQSFVMLKDCKEKFENAPKCRLINPAKSTIGRVSKEILERVNNELRRSTNVQQWRNTQSVIDWFNARENKNKCTFIKFDIVDCYPSITENLLMDAINYDKQHTNISPKEIEIIMHARKSLLFNKDEPWIKKTNDF